MSESFKDALPDLVASISNNYNVEEIFFTKEGKPFPSRSIIIDIIHDFRRLIFPGYFGNETIAGKSPEYFVGDMLMHIEAKLSPQISAALAYYADTTSCDGEINDRAEDIVLKLFKRLPYVQTMLLKDVQAGFDGDPAAQSKEEVIFSYPGMLAMFVYRIAHELYELKVPLIPRIMTEYAHSRTGIDINPGAKIGEYFFMDHGTGIVIGETTEIGNHVKVYQGVTLGALSTRQGQALSGQKRHPTIEDNVTIYSNSSILGGKTVIGANSIIGGNAFIVESVPAYTRVSIKNQEMTISQPQNSDYDWVI